MEAVLENSDVTDREKAKQIRQYVFIISFVYIKFFFI